MEAEGTLQAPQHLDNFILVYIKHYGARGVQVCERWRNSFEAFLEDMGERLEGMTLDRITEGNYEPSNCRWVTRREQTLNRGMIRLITYGGKTQCIKDWADELNIPTGRLGYRLRTGWDVEEALFAKPRSIRHKS